MGFTIGSSRAIRDIRSGTRRRGRTSECTAVAEFTGLWGWDVVAGRAGRRMARAPAATRHAVRRARIRWPSRRRCVPVPPSTK